MRKIDSFSDFADLLAKVIKYFQTPTICSEKIRHYNYILRSEEPLSVLLSERRPVRNIDPKSAE